LKRAILKLNGYLFLSVRQTRVAVWFRKAEKGEGKREREKSEGAPAQSLSAGKRTSPSTLVDCAAIPKP